MPSYHLHRMMRFTCGKDGTAFERDVIVAADVTSAIGEAISRTGTPPGLVLTSATLSARSGAILWSAKAPEADANRLFPTMS